MGRDSRHNYILKQELRRYEPRSRFPNKSPFRPLFRGVLPLSGQQISAEMRKGSPTFWHPGNLVGPQRPLGHCSDASRHTLHARPAGSGHAQTLPRWLLPDTDTRVGKDRTRPDLHERPVFIQYVTEPGDSFGQIKHLPEFAQAVRHGVPELSNRGVNPQVIKSGFSSLHLFRINLTFRSMVRTV